jgi:hypothetical protein
MLDTPGALVKETNDPDPAERTAEDLWDGNPAVTTEWAEAATAYAARRLEPVANGEHLLARLGVRMYGGFEVGLPLTRLDGGFAALPGSDPDEIGDALAQWSRTRALLLPLCDHRVAEAIGDRLPHSIVRPHDVAPLVPEQAVDTWLGQRGKHLRYTTGSARRALHREGGEVVRIPAGRLEASWTELKHVERAGHRRHGHVLSVPFLREAFVALDLAGRIEAWVVRVDGAIAAYAITCVAPRNVYIYTTAMHRNAAPYSPGNVLFETVIVEALRRGRSIHLGPGGSAFKSRFTKDATRLDDVLVLPAGARWAAKAVRFASRRLRLRG